MYIWCRPKTHLEILTPVNTKVGRALACRNNNTHSGQSLLLAELYIYSVSIRANWIIVEVTLDQRWLFFRDFSVNNFCTICIFSRMFFKVVAGRLENGNHKISWKSDNNCLRNRRKTCNGDVTDQVDFYFSLCTAIQTQYLVAVPLRCWASARIHRTGRTCWPIPLRILKLKLSLTSLISIRKVKINLNFSNKNKINLGQS